ncbi:MAG: hypothetical protein RIQ56_637 [Candidatus Parcubacteria bacterium]|jgi:hypothetical protein
MSFHLENSVRFFVACLGVYGALFISAWVSAVCILLLALRFRSWEAVLLGAFIDSMWMPVGGFFPFATVGAICVVWMLEPLRSEFLLQ